MPLRKIKDKIHYVGVIHWDRELFDELIPLPEGTTYNSYIVQGSDNTALIDTVDPDKSEEFFANIDELDVEKIDYVIVNHVEQDHSGSLPLVLEKFPMARIITNAKAKGLIETHLHVDGDKIDVVDDGDVLSLGDKTLEFRLTPWVHWPETMVTFLREDKILFSCDMFGSHFASSDLFVKDEAHNCDGAKRYYAEIMMPFGKNIQGHLRMLADYDIAIIAPSHGPLHDNPQRIMDAYDRWSGDGVENKVLIPWVSMHESTELMVDHLTNKLIELGVAVRPFRITHSDLGEIAMELVDAATVVIGTSTALVGAHPQAAYIAIVANALRPKTKFVSIVGSFGWGSMAVKQITGLIPNIKAEVIEPVYIKGRPDADAYAKLDELAQAIADKHKSIGIM